MLELKCGGSDDVLAKMLIQAAAYAVALRKAWQDGIFGSEWTSKIRKYGFELNHLSTKLVVVPLVCLAPTEFWQNWIGRTKRAKRVEPDDWHAFMELLAGFAVRGFPATFVQLGHAGLDSDKLPKAINATTLDPFVPARLSGSSISP